MAGFVSSKALALFCYLAVNGGREQQRATLAALLWGESPDDDAAASLRQALANLRRLFEPYPIVTRQTVAFDRAAPHWIDCDTFAAALARGTTGRDLAGDIAPYDGPFLDDLIVREAPAFDEWVRAERQRLHALATEALQALVATAMVESDYAGGIDHARHLLRFDPWREETHHKLMLLLARADQRSAALAQFAACCRALGEELGVEPAAETIAL